MNRLFTWIAAAAALIPIGAQAGPTAASNSAASSYCRAWSAKNSSMMKTEFVRSGETVDHWQNMVTIIRYDNVHTVKGAIANYMQVVAPYLGPTRTRSGSRPRTQAPIARSPRAWSSRRQTIPIRSTWSRTSRRNRASRRMQLHSRSTSRCRQARRRRWRNTESGSPTCGRSTPQRLRTNPGMRRGRTKARAYDDRHRYVRTRRGLERAAKPP